MPAGSGTVCLPLGPSTNSSLPTVIFTPLGSGIGFFPTRDINPSLALHFTYGPRGPRRAYQTWQRTSPPTPSLRADFPVMTPRGVVSILIPSPPSTRGTLLVPTYTRQPGRDTRSIREITGTLPGEYFR